MSTLRPERYTLLLLAYRHLYEREKMSDAEHSLLEACACDYRMACMSQWAPKLMTF